MKSKTPTRPKNPATKGKGLYEILKKAPSLPFITTTCPKGHVSTGFTNRKTLTCLVCLGVKG